MRVSGRRGGWRGAWARLSGFAHYLKEHWGALEGLEGGEEHDQFGVSAVGGCVRDWYPGWL